MKLWFTVYFFDIGHHCYDQLTPLKTGYPLTSITWSYRGLKFTAYVFKLTAGRLLAFRLDRVLKLKPDLSLKFNRIITTSSLKMHKIQY